MELVDSIVHLKIKQLLPTVRMTSNIKKNVAVLLIGHMRSFLKVQENLHKYLLNSEFYNCDVYITTYNMLDHVKGIREFEQPKMNIDLEQIKSTYGSLLKDIQVIDQDTFCEQYTKIPNKNYRNAGSISRMYSIERLKYVAYTNFKSNFYSADKYDFILKSRPDIMLNAEFPDFRTLDKNDLITPLHNSGGGFNDQVAFGTVETIDKYMTYYLHFAEMDKLLKDDENDYDVSVIEFGLKKYLEYEHVNLIRYDLKFHIERENPQQQKRKTMTQVLMKHKKL